jgi:PAS domain S-box-containing protein
MTSSLDCVIAMDGAGAIVEFNPAAERTFGYRAEDVLGRQLADLIIPPKDRESHRRGFQGGLATGGWRILGRRVEMTAMRADGTEFPVELALTMVDASGHEGPLFYGFVRDIAERRRGEEQLTYMAYHDPLTGLPNRIQVEQQLDLAVARARRTAGAVALMFIDLDDFKEVNDRLGHAAGDRLLVDVAARLRAVLRDTDLLARPGRRRVHRGARRPERQPHPGGRERGLQDAACPPGAVRGGRQSNPHAGQRRRQPLPR